ncbi:MAG: TrmH family RNA methyltransferase [Parachlamydiales bacterium]
MKSISRAKFLSFSKEKQHKKAAEAARALYFEMREWMGLEPVEETLAGAADGYHEHVRQMGRGVREHNLLPEVREGDREVAGPVLDVSLYLDGIRSAHNVGSILRSAEAFCVKRLYFSPTTPLPTHPQVQKTSMGAWRWVEWEVVEGPPPGLIALETCKGATPLHEFPFRPGCVIAVGNEEYGCSREVLEAAEAVVEIPLYGRKNSLNVANAAAIALYQISFSSCF